MNGKFKMASALFATFTVLGATVATFAAPASANPPVCANVCSFHTGHPALTTTGSKELGLQFQSELPGWIAAVCFWEAPTESGNHTVSLWDSSGTRLGTATSVLAGTPGLEGCVDFSPPVPISANTRYTASYTATTAFETDPSAYFAPVDISPLHAPMNAGVSGSPGAFPTTVSNGDGYGVDIAFLDTLVNTTQDCASSLSAPTSPSSAPGNASATVSWFPATSTPAGCIAGYIVTPFLNGVAQPSTLIPGTGTTTVISGLTNGQSYTFTVEAESGGMVGPASSPVGPVTVGAPTAPTALKVTRASSGSVKVAFKAAHNNHSAITNYTATCKSRGGSTKSKAGKKSPIVVAGLARGGTYTCKVRATNRRGNGPSSRQSSAVKA
jgi:hypothetical protein